MIDASASDSILRFFGIHNEAGSGYAFWSGVGSDIGEYAIAGSLVAGLIGAVRHVNCHEPGCRSIRTHKTADGYRLCTRHIAMSKADLNLHPIHPDHAVK